MIIGVDHDGTVVVSTREQSFRPGAAETLRSLKRAGHALILHSARCQSPSAYLAQKGFLYEPARIPEGLVPSVEDTIRMFAEMRGFYRAHNLWTVDEGGVFDFVWTLPGKPVCDTYLDDRTIDMRPPDAWARVRSLFGA